MPANAEIRVRRDTAADWISVDPVLALGEPGLETDTGKVKWGDGSTAWSGLPYSGGMVDLVMYIDGLPPDNGRIMRFISKRPLTLVESDSLLDATGAATAIAVFQMKKDGVNSGTLTVSAAGTTAAVVISDTDIPADSVLEIFAPSPQDATLENVTITIAAIR